MTRLLLFPLLVLASVLPTHATNVSQLVRPGASGRLAYTPVNAGGDIILDFSHCGYGGGGVPLPHAAEKIRLQPSASGDDTARIQAALDEVARLPLGADRLRGAVVLARGTFRVEGTLRIAASGVVLRGEGQAETDTVIMATGKAPRPLVQIAGSDGPVLATDRLVPVTDAYVPVGARSFTVKDAHGLRVGDTVFVRRHGNAAWISAIGMDRIPIRPGAENTTRQWEPFALSFDRVITAIQGNRVTVDAPLACSIDERWGGGELVPYNDPGRIEHAGAENFRAVSTFDPTILEDYRGRFRYAADEAHALYAVQFDRVQNAWARNITALHFYEGVAMIETGAKWITVQDSRSLAPVSKITGGRRYPFHIAGQLSLVVGCYSEDARHAFVVSSRVPGPNAFVHCVSKNEFGQSEPHHRWSTGGLYDNVESDISFQDRAWSGTGHGWAGANYVAWNTRGTLVCQQPPTAQNFAIGHVGPRGAGTHPRPPGYWESHNLQVEPASLYYAQLRDRLGPDAAGVSR